MADQYDKSKNILFVGEGNFSFTQAFIKREKNLDKNSRIASFIIATELCTKPTLPTTSNPNNDVEKLKDEKLMIERLTNLTNDGVEIIFEIDATKLETYPLINKHRFTLIQWNCPFGGSANTDRNQFKQTLINFFISASKVQDYDATLVVTLEQYSWPNPNYYKIRQAESPIVRASLISGYKLISKYDFNKRYQENGYIHKNNNGNIMQRSQDYDRMAFKFIKTEIVISDEEIHDLRSEKQEDYIKSINFVIENLYGNELNHIEYYVSSKDFYFEIKADKEDKPVTSPAIATAQERNLEPQQSEPATPTNASSVDSLASPASIVGSNSEGAQVGAEQSKSLSAAHTAGGEDSLSAPLAQMALSEAAFPSQTPQKDLRQHITALSPSSTSLGNNKPP